MPNRFGESIRQVSTRPRHLSSAHGNGRPGYADGPLAGGGGAVAAGGFTGRMFALGTTTGSTRVLAVTYVLAR
jgi:hypothetical protein